MSIPDSIVEKILHYATYSFCIEPGYKQTFSICDLDEYGCLPDGHHVIWALVNDPNHCQSVSTITQDSLLMKIASAYLHYYPTQVKCHLTWSIDCNFVYGKIEDLYPVSNFHYDIARYNFATAYFYITPIHDEYSGPFVMLKSSHKNKLLRALVKSGPYSDKTIHFYYDKHNKIQIMGSVRFGFFRDLSYFHKVKVPIGKNRLLLQIRYA